MSTDPGDRLREAQTADFEDAQASAKTVAESEAEKIRRKRLTATQMNSLAGAVLSFCEQVSGVTLYPYERQFGHRVILSLLLNDAAEITALFARQSGKTETVATVVSGCLIILPALAEAFEDPRIARFAPDRGVRIGIYGPNRDRARVMYKRIQNKVFSKRTKALVRSDPTTFKFSLDNAKGRSLELPNGSLCEAHTARPNADIEGETWDLIVCEEAQALDTVVVKKCLAEGTMVPLPDGSSVPVEEAVADRLDVLATDGLGAPYAQTPTEWHDNGVQECLEIELASGRRFTATRNHRWMSRRCEGNRQPQERVTEGLQIGDSIPRWVGAAALAKERTASWRGCPADIFWDRIVRIREAGEHRTYCVTVPSSWWIIGDGVISGNSIHPMGAATAATRVKIGTPDQVKCEFLSCIERNRKADARGDSKHLQLHFEFDCDVAARHNPQYARYLRSEKVSLGENSDEFRMAYKLEWLLERGMFMPPELIRSMRLDLTVCPSDKRNPHVFGIDFGKTGSHTVITIGRVHEDRDVEGTSFMRMVVVNWLELQGVDHEKQFPQIVNFLNNYRLLRGVCDATGVGDPIVSRLAAELKPRGVRVFPMVFGSSTKDALYRHLDQEIQAGRIRVCASPHTQRMRKFKRFEEQMEGLVREFRGALMVVHKDDDDPKAHDDYPDSLALTAWAAGSLLEGQTKTRDEGVFKTKSRDRGFQQRRRSRERNPIIGSRSGRRIPQW